MDFVLSLNCQFSTPVTCMFQLWYTIQFKCLVTLKFEQLSHILKFLPIPLIFLSQKYVEELYTCECMIGGPSSISYWQIFKK